MDTVRSALSSPRATRVLFWLGAAVLVAGVAFFLVRFFGRDTAPTGVQSPPSPPPLAQRQVKLDPAARRVAREFIETAVRRKHLARAWALSHPDLRQGMTLKEWLTGNIPVVPYTLPIGHIRLRVTYSTVREAQLRATLVPRSGSEADIAEFEIGLRKVGSGTSERWLVDYWGPASTLAPPRTTAR